MFFFSALLLVYPRFRAQIRTTRENGGNSQIRFLEKHKRQFKMHSVQ